jgi:hypothetical protein
VKVVARAEAMWEDRKVATADVKEAAKAKGEAMVVERVVIVLAEARLAVKAGGARVAAARAVAAKGEEMVVVARPAVAMVKKMAEVVKAVTMVLARVKVMALEMAAKMMAMMR